MTQVADQLADRLMVTVPEAARALSVSAGTVRNLIRAGRLDAVLTGGAHSKFLVSVASVRAFADTKGQR